MRRFKRMLSEVIFRRSMLRYYASNLLTDRTLEVTTKSALSDMLFAH